MKTSDRRPRIGFAVLAISSAAAIVEILPRLTWRRASAGVAQVSNRSIIAQHQRHDDRDDPAATSEALAGRAAKELGLRRLRAWKSARRVQASRPSPSVRARYVPSGNDQFRHGPTVH